MLGKGTLGSLLVALLVALVTGLPGPADAGSVPVRPSAPSANPGDARADLSWVAPSDGGSPITGYRVRWSSNGGASWVIRTTGSTSTAYEVSPLTNGQGYVFQVRAGNASGWSKWSASSARVTPVATVTPQPPGGTWWRPAVGTSWQVQYTGTIDLSADVAVFDLDWEDTSAAQVATLKARGVRAICYLSAGSWEDWRADAGDFPAQVLGSPLDGWAGERWLDVRQRDVLLPIMERRVATCRDKGFDAVDPDNVDGYTNRTCFSLTAADQLAYNRELADLAHRYGMGVGLKNDAEQVRDLVSAFDFAVVESCVVYSECGAYAPFTASGKAVLHIEYEGTLESVCPVTSPLSFSTMLKNLNLGAWRQPCPSA
jgi:hypothetical protein